MLLVTPGKNIIRLSIHCQIISGMAVCFLRPEQQNIDDILPALSSSMVRFSVFLSFGRQIPVRVPCSPSRCFPLSTMRKNPSSVSYQGTLHEQESGIAVVLFSYDRSRH
jgi:hypothetical protein